MALDIVGAGFGRTGTLSLKHALERLGFAPCYHMSEVVEHPEHVVHWQAAVDGREVDWDALFAGYRAAVDWPVAAFWPALAAHYPHAKIILSTRDESRWYESMSGTILQAVRREPGPGSAVTPEHRRMTRGLILERTFGGRPDDRDHVIGVYRANTERVMAEIPSERLLHHRPADGWTPLCAFLGVNVPDEPYPRVNDTAEFREKTGLDR